MQGEDRRCATDLAQAGIVFAIKVDISDCAEVGLELAGDRESLLHRTNDVFILKGGDWSGEMVSSRSSESELEVRSSTKRPVVGENNGRGTATDEPEEALSEDGTLPTVVLLRGTTDRPSLGYG